MPILTISEVVNNELSQMRFRFGGSPADVVEYADGGRKASGQASAVQGLHVVTDSWASYDEDVVPTADGNGVVPEFYGPQGIIALRADYGFGFVILRADAASLHKELREILLDRLSQLQVDNDTFRAAVTGELDAMRAEIDNAVANALDDVQALIDTSLGDTIDDAVDAKLDTDLAPTLEAAVNSALATGIPPLITAEVASKVPPAVTAQVAGLQSDIDDNAADIATTGVTLANTRYDLDALRARVTAAEADMNSVETLVSVTAWSRTVTFTDCFATLKLYKFQNIVFGDLYLNARTTNGGSVGYVERSGMGIPAAFIPKRAGAGGTLASTVNSPSIRTEPFWLGINLEGQIFTRSYAAWQELGGSLLYFT